MTKVTVEEPKSVIEEVERYECDKCGYRGEYDEVVSYRMDYDTEIVKGHLCNDCAEAGRYADLVEMTDVKTRIGDRIDWTVDVGSLLVPFGSGVAMATAGTFVLWQAILIPSVSEGGLINALLLGTVLSVLCSIFYGLAVGSQITVDDLP